MVRVNCDYIPAWPIVYYVKKSYTILHLLWPAITWKESKNGNKVFAFFYIFFRLAWNESKETQFVDFFWPIIHLEYSGRGFRFGIRPLFWIISTDRTFKLTLLGIFTIVSKNDGDDIWVVLFPFIWYRYKNGRSLFTLLGIFWLISNTVRFRLFLVPFLMLSKSRNGEGFWFNLALLLHVVNSDKRFYMHILPFLFIHRKVSNGTTHVNIAGLFHVMTTDSKRFYMHILPFLFINRKSSGTLHVNFMVVMHYRRTSSGTLFVLAPFLFVYHGTSNFFLFIVPLLLVSRSKSRNMYIVAFIYYRIVKLVKERTFTLLLPVFVHWTNGDDYFVNVLALFTQKYDAGDSNRFTLLFPFLWIRKHEGHSFMFHLWPLFGYKVSYKEGGGYNIYIMYPVFIYKRKQNGQLTRCYCFYPLGYYYNDRDDKKFKVHAFPFFFYSNMRGITKGVVLLYFWYTDPGRAPTRTIDESSGDTQPTYASSPDELAVRAFIPLFFFVTKTGGNKLIVLLPLFICRWKSDVVNSLFLSLIYYQRRRDEEVTRWLLPVFYQKHTFHRDLVLSPIYVRWRKDANSVMIVVPVYIDVVKAETHLRVITFPIVVYYRKTIFKFVTIFPFFFRTQDASKNELFTYIFPIFGRSTSGSAQRSHYVLFPLFRWRVDEEKESKAIDIIFPLFHFDRSPLGYSLRLLPFFWRSVSEENEFTLVMPFFWRFVTDKTTRAQSNTLFLPFYFKRDSAQYEFTFASPALLPPYYVHYHREASQVEQTYVFPFYAHKIKGLDHLRWFLLVLYRHSWRDFSDNMFMNILLFFKYVKDDTNIMGIIPLFIRRRTKITQQKVDDMNGDTPKIDGGDIVVDNNHLSNYVPDTALYKYQLRILLLLAVDKTSTSLKKYTRVALFWLVSNRVSLFTWRHSVKVCDLDADLKVKRNASKVDLFDTQLPSKDMVEMEDTYKDLPPTNIISSTKVYLWPLFHAKNRTDNLDKLNYYHFSMFWIAKPWLAFFHRLKSAEESKAFMFLVFYYRVQDLCRHFALLWLFNPIISLFLREATPFAVITRLIPFFWHYKSSESRESKNHHKNGGSLDSSVGASNKHQTILSIVYIVPRYGLINYNNDEVNGHCTHYFLPVYYSCVTEQSRVFALLWFAIPLISLFYYKRHDMDGSYHRLFPIYYRKHDKTSESSLLSIVWIVHPVVALFRVNKSQAHSIVALFPVFWKKSSLCNGNDKFHLSLLYIVPRFGFIDYAIEESPSGDEIGMRFYILLLYFLAREDGRTYVSLIYLVHPKASLLRGCFTASKSKLFMFPFIYYKRDTAKLKMALSIVWIGNPRFGFISYWSQNDGQYTHFHIPLVLWISSIDEYYQWGVFWIACAKASQSGNPFTNQNLPNGCSRISSVYYPVSLFMYYSDGQNLSHHLMPIYRYRYKTRDEAAVLWVLLGAVYLLDKQDITEFRFFYRWIKVKSSETVFVLEVNPFVSIRRKHGKSRVLILGGMCGVKDSTYGSGSTCNFCCIEC